MQLARVELWCRGKCLFGIVFGPKFARQGSAAKSNNPLLLYFDYEDVSLYTFSPRRLHLGIVLCTKSEIFEDWIIACIDGQYVAPGRWEGVKGNVEGTDL